MKCPECNSGNVVKRGIRKQKFGSKQLYFCKHCGKRFADQTLKYKIHSPRVIYHALNYYNLGYTLKESSKLVNRRFKVKTGKSTIHPWINEFKNLCPISSARQCFSGPGEYGSVLFTKRFEHENLDYEFMYHKYKLDVLSRKQFPGLFKYIKNFEDGCPNVFFEVGERCSRPKFETKVKARKKTNLACKMVDFAIKAARNNYERHNLVEKFMLINDKATVACEVPVWYWRNVSIMVLLGILMYYRLETILFIS
jgi:transposase-like protein